MLINTFKAMTNLKLLLPLLLILTGKICVGQSKDTLCFPTNQIKAVLIDAEKGKVYKQQVTLLNSRIDNLGFQIKELEQKNDTLSSGMANQIKLLSEQKGLFQSQLDGYEKLLRRERRKRTFTTIAGGLITGIFGYLYLVK